MSDPTYIIVSINMAYGGPIICHGVFTDHVEASRIFNNAVDGTMQTSCGFTDQYSGYEILFNKDHTQAVFRQKGSFDENRPVAAIIQLIKVSGKAYSAAPFATN